MSGRASLGLNENRVGDGPRNAGERMWTRGETTPLGATPIIGENTLRVFTEGKEKKAEEDKSRTARPAALSGNNQIKEKQG